MRFQLLLISAALVCSPACSTTSFSDSAGSNPESTSKSEDAAAAPPATDKASYTKLAPAPETCTPSQNSSQPVSLAYANHCDFAVDVWWVDFNCKLVSYGSIEPGATLNINTFATHPWRILVHGTKNLVTDFIVTAAKKNGDSYNFCK